MVYSHTSLVQAHKTWKVKVHTSVVETTVARHSSNNCAATMKDCNCSTLHIIRKILIFSDDMITDKTGCNWISPCIHGLCVIGDGGPIMSLSCKSQGPRLFSSAPMLAIVRRLLVVYGWTLWEIMGPGLGVVVVFYHAHHKWHVYYRPIGSIPFSNLTTFHEAGKKLGQLSSNMYSVDECTPRTDK